MSFYFRSMDSRVATNNTITKDEALGEWTNKIYFDSEADKPCSKNYAITDKELRKQMKMLIEQDEKIFNVYAYRNPIWGWQLTNFFMSHWFIVFETEKWWWSLEKNTEGITIQRSEEQEFVLNRYRREKRPEPIVKIDSDKGNRNMNNLVEFLYRKDELYRKYNLYDDNCQHFAKRIFDEIANSKSL